MHDATYMQNWRAATEHRIGAFLDELYTDRLRKYYAVAKKDEPTRPILEQGIATVLDDLFDETHYPDGMDFDAVIARAEAEFAPQLKAIFEPQWDALVLKGKRNHYKNARSWSMTALGEDFVYYSQFFVDMMQEEAQALKREERQRHVLPMGADALRLQCLEQVRTHIDAMLDQLVPYYAIDPGTREAVQQLWVDTVNDAFAKATTDEEGLQRQALVDRVLDERFATMASEAAAAQQLALAPKRAGLAPKDVAALVGLGQVYGGVRRAVRLTANQAFVNDNTAEPTPSATVEADSIVHQGAVDYGKVPFMHGNDMVSREWNLKDRVKLLITGDAKLEPLSEAIFKAVRDAGPPIGKSKVKTVKHYFTWLEKESGPLLEAKLKGIEELGANERNVLLDMHREVLPEMLNAAQRNGDHLAGEMDKRGMKWR